jgi:hypothetical protein
MVLTLRIPLLSAFLALAVCGGCVGPGLEPPGSRSSSNDTSHKGGTAGSGALDAGGPSVPGAEPGDAGRATSSPMSGAAGSGGSVAAPVGTGDAMPPHYDAGSADEDGGPLK